MAFERQIEPDVSGNASPNATNGIPQFTAVVADTAGGAGMDDMIVATATTLPAFGINQSVGSAPSTTGGGYGNVSAGQSMAIRRRGVSKVRAGGAITIGAYVAVDSSGRAVAVSSLNPATTATNSYILGQALSAATQAEDLVSVELMLGTTTLVTA